MAEASAMPRDGAGSGTYALLLLAPALFASNNIAARLADGTVPPVALAFFRWAVTAAVLIPFLAPGLWRKRVALAGEGGRLVVLGCTGIVLTSVATYAGALWTSAINIGLIYSATPALILGLDRLSTGRPVSAGEVCGLALCCAGVLCIVLRDGLAGLMSLDFSTGDLIVAGGALGWAVYSVLLKRWPSELTVPERASATALVGTLILLPLFLVESLTFRPVVFDGTAFLVIATVGLLAGVGVVLSHAYLTARLGPRGAVVLLYLIPLYNTALAWALLGERVGLSQLVGGALILGGVFIATTSIRRPSSPLPLTDRPQRAADGPPVRSPSK
jgi:drug/metabolite transporter (DMT)-like permease